MKLFFSLISLLSLTFSSIAFSEEFDPWTGIQEGAFLSYLEKSEKYFAKNYSNKNKYYKYKKEDMKIAVAKMAIVISQFSKSKPDYNSLVEKMLENVEKNGVFKGLIEPSLKLTDSLIASKKIRVAKTILEVITDLDLGFGISIMSALNIHPEFEENFEEEDYPEDHIEEQMHGLLYDVEIDNNQISFGHSLLEDFEDFRSNFSNSMNGSLEERNLESLMGMPNSSRGGSGEFLSHFTNSTTGSLEERSGLVNSLLGGQGDHGNHEFIFNASGPIFGSPGIDTMAARASMGDFLNACNEGCHKAWPTGTIVGGAIGGVLGSPTGPGIAVSIGAGGTAGGIIACGIGCATGVAVDVIDTYNDIGGQLDEVTGFTGTVPHNPHGEPGHQPTTPTIPTTPVKPTTPDITVTPTIPTTPSTTEGNGPSEVPITEVPKAPDGCETTMQNCEAKGDSKSFTMDFDRDFSQGQLGFDKIRDISEIITPVVDSYDNFNDINGSYETDFNPDRLEEISTPSNGSPLDDDYDNDTYDRDFNPDRLDEITTPSPIEGGSFGDYGNNGGSDFGFSGSIGGGFSGFGD